MSVRKLDIVDKVYFRDEALKREQRARRQILTTSFVPILTTVVIMCIITSFGVPCTIF